MYRRHGIFWPTINQFFENPADPGGGAKNGDPKDPPKDPKDPKDPPKKVEFDDEQQAELNRIIARERADAERKAEEKITSQAAKEKQDAEAEAERKRQEDAGEYEKAKATLVQERDEFKAKAETAEAELTRLTGVLQAQYDTAIGTLPETILAFKPKDEATLSEKMDWLKTAQEQAEKLGEITPPGNRPNPGKPVGQHTPTAPDFKKERISLIG